QWLTERAIKKADKIIAVSHRSEKDLIAHLGIDAKKITVSYIDVDEIYKKEVSEKESQRVLKKYNLEAGYIYSGGGLEVRKNTENVLRAYKILFEAYGHASWLPKVVVSGKMMPQLAPLVTDVEAAVKGLGLEKEVSLLDFVPQEDLPALYKNASVFVYPSLYEGFGLPVLEAMNQGTPVITSKTSSLPEVGSDSVVYCDPKSVDDLAMVLKNVLMNNHLLSSLSMKGKERATHFSWDKFTEKMINIIIDLKK
ncbi:MAG: glycosyltransferase family 1 protein, partial [Candidatus Moranbacteria bacterium]|nr:glycosyltransferase family 1 protein [Candidatus Moranbacteria bacterium]